MKSLMALGALIAIGGVVYADAPQVPTPAPYIVLSDNHDEPNGYGFCLDTDGRGQSDLMHSHSCKPERDGESRVRSENDTRFSFDPNTGQIASHVYDDVCMQVLIARGRTVFGLLPCSDHPRQKFVYDDADQTLRLAENTELCVGVAPETLPAGSWVKRMLTLQKCEEVDASLKQWNVVSE